MEYKKIQVDSFIGTSIHMELATQNSDTLLVLLPGAGYNILGPMFYYSYGMGTELGLDILSVEYGFERAQRKFEYEFIDSVIEETKLAVDAAVLEGRYSRMIFIAKSLGTQVMSMLLPNYIRFNPILIYYTPSFRAIDCIRNNSGLVVLGTKDSILKNISIEELQAIESIELYLVEGGDHSLDVERFEESIDELKAGLIRTRDYILSSK